MATFNVLASCICRDGFGFRKDNRHDVRIFLQSTSPITWFEFNDKPFKTLDIDSFSEMPTMKNFRKKCIINDYNKTVLDYFEDNADYFVIDFLSFAGANLAKVKNNQIEHYFTYSKWFKEAYAQGLHNQIEGNIEIIDRYDLLTDKRIEETLSLFVNWLRNKGYSENQIILVENKKVFSYSDDKAIYYFENATSKENVNNALDRINSCFKRLMPKCHVIKMPSNVYADSHHPWGLTDLHYCKDYYDYLYECYDAIASNNDCKDYIYSLYERYSATLEAKKDTLIRHTLSCLHGEQLLKGSIDSSDTTEIIVPTGTKLYPKPSVSPTDITASRNMITKYYNRDFSTVKYEGNLYFVNNDDCISGFCGNNKIIGSKWKTINSSTLVTLKNNSFIISHNGNNINAQMQIIQTLDDVEFLCGKIVTLSVWARVIEYNDTNTGGTIGIINADNYNKGAFYAKKNFNNKEWRRITLTSKLPDATHLKGITICLRAIAGKGNPATHATVEFSDPILYLLNKDN